MNFCGCTEDGYCPRYRREMGGRMRELCAGVNVDLGTAAAFREQWAREAGDVGGTISSRRVRGGKKLLLKTGQAPGDAVAMTAAIYSLHRAHPNKYDTAVESYWPDVFEHNPDVSEHLIPDGTTGRIQGAAEVEMHYPSIHRSNEYGVHFMYGWCEHLAKALGVSIPLLTNRPRLYFDTPEPPVSDFWLVCSGGKRDFTTKLWGHYNYQRVVDLLKGRVQFVQVGGAKLIVPWRADVAKAQEDSHIPLDGVENMLGKTTLRELFELTRRARGVLCTTTLLMHIASALRKPSVIIAGGREPVQWNSYPLQRYLHTVGSLPCYDSQGRAGACWRYRTRSLGDNTTLDSNTCLFPVGDTPKCMTLISPGYVAETILQMDVV